MLDVTEINSVPTDIMSNKLFFKDTLLQVEILCLVTLQHPTADHPSGLFLNISCNAL